MKTFYSIKCCLIFAFLTANSIKSYPYFKTFDISKSITKEDKTKVPNTAPTFNLGASTNLFICNQSGSISINDILVVSDTDVEQVLTWSVATSPTNGTLNGFPTTAPSPGMSITPSGLTYISNINSNDSFVVQITDGIATAQITVNVIVNPDSPVASGVSVCNGSNASLSATCTSGEISWYDASTGGTLLSTANPYITSPLTSNTTYYVACEAHDATPCSSSVCVSNRTEVVATIINVSRPDINVEPIVCPGNSTILTATCTTGTVTWYSSSTGTSALATGESYNTGPISTPTNFYASCEFTVSGGEVCVSSRSRVIVDVFEPLLPPNASNKATCYNKPAVLTASCANGVVTWYNNATGGAIGTGSPFSTRDLVVDSEFYVNCESLLAPNCPSSRILVSVDVFSLIVPPTPITTDTTICYGASAVLSATCLSGSIRWYDSASGGTILSYDVNYITPALISPMSYFVLCESGESVVCESERVQVDVSQYPDVPKPFIIKNAIICSNSSALIVAGCLSGSVVWYDMDSGGSSIAIGDTLTTPVLTASANYYAACNVGAPNDCESGRIAATVTVLSDNNRAVLFFEDFDNPGITPSRSRVAAIANAKQCNCPGPSIGSYPFSPGWFLANVDNLIPSSTYDYVNDAWERGEDFIFGNLTDTVAISTSSYNPAGTAGDWMWTPLIGTITTGTKLSWKAASGDPVKLDGYEVRVRDMLYGPPTGGPNDICTMESLSDLVFSTTGEGNLWSNHEVDLSVYAGKSVYIGFRNNTIDGSVLLINDVQVDGPIENPTVAFIDSTICYGSNISLEAACENGVVTWYRNEPTDGTPIATGSPLVDAPIENTIFYVACELGSCGVSARDTIEITINPIPDDPDVSNQDICSGSSIMLTANCDTGIVTWYDSLTATTALGTGSYNTGSLTNTTQYFVSCELGISPFCISQRVEVTVNVIQIPTAPISSNQTICSASSASLTATCNDGGVVKWYASLTATIPLSTGTYNTGSLIENTSYFASCEIPGINPCTSTTRTEVIVTVNPNNPPPTGTSNQEVCNGFGITLTATCTTGTLAWYGSMTATTALGTGSYNTGSLTNTTVYFASCETNVTPNCGSPRTPVTVTVNPNPPAPTDIINQNICSGLSTTLTGTCTGSTVTWYSSLTATNALGSGDFNTGILNTTTHYFATCETKDVPNCVTVGERIVLVVTVKPTPTEPTGAASQTICSGFTPTTLTATCATGTLKWYSSLTGTAVLSTGSYNPGVLTNNTASPIVNSYFAVCESGGELNCESFPRTQVIITVNMNPIAPAGATNPTICSGFSTNLTATCTTGSVIWYGSLTGTTSVGSGTFNTGALTNVSSSPTVLSYFAACESGGAPNCVSPRTQVNVTVNPNPTAPTVATNPTICSGFSTNLTATCATGSVVWYGSLTGIAVLSTGSYNPGVLTNNTGSPIVSSYFAACESGETPNCVSIRTQVNVTVNPNPTAPTVATNPTICSGFSTILTATCATGSVVWYGSLTGTAVLSTVSYNPGVLTNNTGSPIVSSYFAACESGGTPNCVSIRTQVNVTVNPNPTAPTAATNPTICSGFSTILTATCATGSVVWYGSLTGAAAVGSGTFNTGALTNVTTSPTVSSYFAACESGGVPNCVSPRTQVNVTVNPNPTAPTATTNPTICSGFSTNLTATCATGSVVWYGSLTGTAVLSTGSYNPGVLTNNTGSPIVSSYFAACESGGVPNCVSPRTQVNVTVNPNPTAPTAATNPTICSGFSTILTATCATGSVVWYGSLTGTAVLSTVSYNPGVLTNVTTSPTVSSYFAACESGGVPNCVSIRTQVNVTVNPNPTAPTAATNPTICSGFSTILTATCATGSVVWYGSLTGAAAVGSGTFNTGALTNVTTSPTVSSYFAACESGGVPNCVSPRTQVNVTVNPNPTAPTATTNPTICSGFSTNLTATCATGSVIWYGSLTGTTAVGSDTFNTGALTNVSSSPTVLSYFAACESGGVPNCVSPRTQVNVTVNPNPTAPTATTNPTICSGFSTNLTATCATGSVVWYGSLTGTTLLATGSYNPGVLTNNTGSPIVNSYFAVCESGGAPNCVSPRTQVNVTVNSNPTAPTAATNPTICSGFSTILTATCATGSVVWYGSLTGTAVLSTVSYNPGVLTNNTGSPIVSSYFAACESGGTPNCVSIRTQVNVTVNPNPTAPTAATNPTICSGFSTILTATCATGSVVWYGSLTGAAAVGSGTFNTGALTNVTTSPTVSSYFAACESGGVPNCVSPRTQVNVTVNPNPTAPTATTNPTICSGFSTNLTATCATGSVVWYGSLTGATLLATGSYNPGVLTNNTGSPIVNSYFAACESGGVPNCVSIRTQVNVTVNPNPIAQASNNGPYTVGQTLEIYAIGGTTYTWSGPNSFSSNLPSPTIPNSLSVNGGVYTVTVIALGCTATATTNVIVNGVDPCVRIVDYSYVKAGNPYQSLFPLSNAMIINQITDQVSILVTPVCNSVPIESFEMNIQGPELNWNIIQNVSPFFLFDNFGESVNGRNFIPGNYTLTVTGYSQDNKGGGQIYGPVVTTFTVVGNLATISQPTLSTSSLCAGSSVSVTFTTTGSFDPGNQFQVQLSNAAGSFEYPVVIGTSNVAGTINCTIPLSTAGGSNYFIRVASSSQVLAGNPTMGMLTINPANMVITTSIAAGTVTNKATQAISATNRVISPANVTYQAGNAVILNTGFEAGGGAVFKAEIKACGN